jgi:diadenosine tetraphosphatase ApaH/serine/threonine PP2A family protein phosphatase
MGNADAWLLTGEETGAEKISEERLAKMNEVRTWSLSQLSSQDRTFIAGFQATVAIPLNPSRNLLCFHGSPTSFDDIILPTTPEEKFQQLLGGYIPHVLTGGHTHLQQLRRLGVSESFFFNPGSVGLAYSHQQPEESFRVDRWAEYAVLSVEADRLRLEFRRVPFDTTALIAVYRSNGRPHAAEAIAQYQS